MNIEKIRSEAPEGATHYASLDFIGDVEYFKVYLGENIMVWDGIWHKLIEDQYKYILSRIKPLF